MTSPVVAAVFPGQGAEEPGIGLEWLDDPLFSVAAQACGVDVRTTLGRFTADLARTSVLQPVLLALALAAWSRLSARGVRADFVAGHSVGELGAWAATGAISAEEAVVLGSARGAAMEREASRRPGAMLALPADVDLACVLEEGRREGILDLAARNGPKQIVVSGDTAAVACVERRFGGRRLSVSGAWHSALVQGAKDDLARALERVAITGRGAGPRLISGLDGNLLASGARPDLAAQVTAPVAWDRVMSAFAREGVTDVVALAPGRTARGLLRDGLGTTVRIRVADSDRDLDAIARSLAPEAPS